MSLKTVIRIHARQWTVLNVTELIIYRVEKLADDKGISEMVDGEMLFEWDPREPILLLPDYEEVAPPLYHTVNEKSKGEV